MNAKTEAEKSSVLDTVLLALALLVLGGGFVGYFYLQDQADTWIRMLGLLVVIALAAVIGSRTVKGRTLLQFFREADIERRKVVWPTRTESIQTTIMVLIVTFIVAIMLFVMDWVFAGLVRWLIGAGG